MTKADPAAGREQTAQKLCPVMGQPIDKNISADYDGRRVYFCCGMCKPKFEDDAAKYVAKLDAELAGAATE